MSSTSRVPDLQKRVAEFFRKHRLSLSGRILVGFSGGPDSRALLELLAGLARRHPLRLEAAYLDHGLRPEQERREELALIGRVCAGLGVSLHSETLPPGLLETQAKAGGRSLEELAREVRHRFLLRTAERLGCGLIALGHTLDDQAETLIMRLFQGAGLGGLAGIPERRGAVVRPLLSTRRSELLRYLQAKGLEYRLDSSNRDARYLRNAVRSMLVPALERIFPGFRQSLASLAGLFEGLGPFLEEQAAERLDWKPAAGGGYRIAARRLISAPAYLRLLSLLALLPELGIRARRVPLRFFSPLLRREALRSRTVIVSGRGIRLRRLGGDYALEKDIVGTGKKGYLIAVEPHRQCAVPQAGWLLSVGEAAVGGRGSNVDVTATYSPLVVRSGIPADRLSANERSTGVNKLCSEWRIPLTERWKVPIVEDANGVLAVLGAVVGGVDRVRRPAAGAARWTLAVRPIERGVEGL